MRQAAGIVHILLVAVRIVDGLGSRRVAAVVHS